LSGDAGDDRLVGGKGNDERDGYDGADDMLGEDGRDELAGYSGNDLLKGGNGNDRLFGMRGQNDVNGNDGKDVLIVSEGKDVLNGGDGDDRFEFHVLAREFKGTTIEDFNTRKGDFDVADVDGLFKNLDALLANAKVGEISGKVSTTIDVAGNDLVLLGYDITKDKDVGDHFLFFS
jgi:Ca2+-binding RTX toxin-like protein